MDKFFNSDNVVMLADAYLSRVLYSDCYRGGSNDIAVLCKCKSAAPQPQLCLA